MVVWVVGRDLLVGEGDGRDLLEADGFDDVDREFDGAVNLKNHYYS